MSDTTIWIVILALAVLTYLIRFSFIGILAGKRLPPVVMEALGYVPVTVLPAIIAPMVLLGPGGSFEADPQRVVAALVALAVGAVARSLLGAIVAGMTAFILWGALGL